MLLRLLSASASLLVLLLPSARLPAQSADDFNPQLYSSVYALAVQDDGKILAGGDGLLSRFYPDGTRDPTFALSGYIPGSVYCLGIQSDEKVLVGGWFNQLQSQTRNNLARLNPSGTLDTAFNPGANDRVNCFALQPDGKILVGGRFTFLGHWTSLGIARLNTDGTLDTNFTFVAQTLGTVNAIAVQPDGRIVVGGIFGFSGSGQQRTNISRLNADGTSDMSFQPAVNGWVEALAVQPDGKILVGGCFGSVSGQPRTNLARLNPDGTVDVAFNPGAGVFTQPGAGSSFVFSVALQADGKILVGGFFDSLGGQTCYCLGRLQGNGDFDPGFNPGASSYVYALALQPDGKLLAGGSFSMLGSTPRNDLGRLNNSALATEALSSDGSTVTWLRGGTSPEAWETSFALSTDGVSWTNLGSGTRIPGGWQLAGFSAPANAILRARGQISSGEGAGSPWFVENFLGPPTANRPALNLTRSVYPPVLSIQGDTGRPYAVEFTAALPPSNSWQPLSFLLLTNSPQDLVDWSASNSPQRFYRARLNQ